MRQCSGRNDRVSEFASVRSSNLRGTIEDFIIYLMDGNPMEPE